jgi:hypothetical protein
MKKVQAGITNSICVYESRAPLFVRMNFIRFFCYISYRWGSAMKKKEL